MDIAQWKRGLGQHTRDPGLQAPGPPKTESKNVFPGSINSSFTDFNIFELKHFSPKENKYLRYNL